MTPIPMPQQLRFGLASWPTFRDAEALDFMPLQVRPERTHLVVASLMMAKCGNCGKTLGVPTSLRDALSQQGHRICTDDPSFDRHSLRRNFKRKVVAFFKRTLVVILTA